MRRSSPTTPSGSSCFEQVRVIVIDELHTYRGLFGSHVANVIRRLLRLCAHYGSHPVIITCSATIANPGELATLLTGRGPVVVDRNGAPSGERHILFVDTPVIDAASGARGSALTLAQRWALPFIRAGRQTIVFARSRTAVEVVLTGLRETLREHHGPRTKVRGYRGGYLPTERRAIEGGLRDGEVMGVVSTNALELGVDIGRLDVSVLAGYPGSIAATWQQIGRAGRRQNVSAAILVASAAPVDQYVVHHPGVPPRQDARGGPDRPGQPARAPGPPAGGHLRDAVRARRGLRTGARRRAAGLPRRERAGAPGRRRPLVLELGELPGLGDLAAHRRPRERRDHRHDAGPAARAGRGGPVLRPGARPPARDLHARVGPVPRRPARMGRAEGLRPPHRRRSLHVREPGRDPQAARRLRGGARHRRPPPARRGDGRQPRHLLQEAQVRHRRERRLGADRPAGDRAPDDGLLGRRRRPPRAVAARGARRRAARRRTGDADRRERAPDGRPAGPRPRHPGPLAARGGADDLPVRGGAGRRRDGRAALAPARRPRGGRRRPGRGVRLRDRLSVVYRAPPRRRGGGARCARACDAAPRRPRGAGRRRPAAARARAASTAVA